MCLPRCKLGFPSEPGSDLTMVPPLQLPLPAPRTEGPPHPAPSLLQGQRVRLQQGEGTVSPSGNISGPRSDFMFFLSSSSKQSSALLSRAGLCVEGIGSWNGRCEMGASGHFCVKPVLTFRKTGTLPALLAGLKENRTQVHFGGAFGRIQSPTSLKRKPGPVGVIIETKGSTYGGS